MEAGVEAFGVESFRPIFSIMFLFLHSHLKLINIHQVINP